MKNLISTCAIALIAVGATACHKAEAPKASTSTETSFSEADAAKVADDTVKVWTSMDAAKIKALYSPSVVAYDFAAAALPKDRAEFDKRQDDFAAAKLDGASQVERKIQVLSPNSFVMSGTWNMTSSTKPAGNGGIRCTDVFQNDTGKWTIVNEHCSMVPKPV